MKRLNDSQLKEAEDRARLSGIPINQCATCFSKLIDGEIECGTYKLFGEVYECNCREQIRLRQAYLYANIPDLYMRLSWDQYVDGADYISAIKAYIEGWPSFKVHGMGIAFLSKSLGVGKTYLSTLIGKELLKRGETVYFLPHNQMTYALRYNDLQIVDKMNHTTVLILDDIQAPPHDTLEGIFADQLENIIRNRTNYNGVTILSSNLTEDELKSQYQRVWSVLEPKVMVQKIEGEDARQSFVSSRTLDMAVNNERFPIQ